MRAPKERLHRVLVIGATPAGIAATNKLGEMGIPVTLVDSDEDLNRKLAEEKWRLTSGVPLNYALRPGLLRILRNPRIHCVLPGRITSIKHTPQGFAARIKGYQSFIDPERCTLCGLCADACPVEYRDGAKPIHYADRQSLPGRAFIDKRSKPLCQENCPLGVNVQGYMALAKNGKFSEALDLIRRDNVLPGICGRICTHPCEAACRRSELDEPLAIRDIKRFVADCAAKSESRTTKAAAQVEKRPEKIAIIGSGPAGLAAAADLARLGYGVTVFEKEEKPGGLLRYGIGPHRLPRDVLDSEIRFIEGLGVEFKTSSAIDLSSGLDDLKKEYASVIIANGTWKDRKLGAPGEDLARVNGCVELLGKVYRGEIKELKESVAVIGDGNAALDLARALVRLGAEVAIISWFPEELIPADREEVEAAREEGISFVYRTQVVGFKAVGKKSIKLRCASTEPGKPDANGIPWPVLIQGKEPFELAFDRAVVAIGQAGDPELFATSAAPRATASGYVETDSCRQTSIPAVYAAGDIVSGPSSVVQAMASGRESARAIHRALSGEELPEKGLRRPLEKAYADISPDIPSQARADMAERQPGVRKSSFEEVALGLTEAQTLSEASRCLQCGVCSECLQCAEVCLAGAIRHDSEPESEETEQAGVVIIADPAAAPPVKGEDVIRAYNAKAAEEDVFAMMVRGFAAAAEAMIMLGDGAQRLRGHGLSFGAPDPKLSPEIKLGVFVCRCNDVFGWKPELNDYIDSLTEKPEVAHAESIPSACTPEGSAAVLRTIREKGLTRIVMASCVCCPLDFICSACTDQRSRLKDALFNGTGLSRAMFETCNLRGEALRLLEDYPELAVNRFEGLIDRSIGRAKHLKAMPLPVRPYNFTTAVIGDSEAAIKSAMTLAEIGMEVFLFGIRDRQSAKSATHPNIHRFDGSSVKGIRGTVGNFEVVVETDGSEKVFHAGAVILGEQSRKRIPYMPMADLPPHMVESSMQKRGVTGIPFFSPGATSIPGLFLANPHGVNVSERTKGAAAAIFAASVMPRRPRQNKGYTVVVEEARCRGCGRCVQVCPYQAVSFRSNSVGGWCAVVDEALCKGCGNCISVCPSNAADSPYRDRLYLEQMVDEILL